MPRGSRPGTVLEVNTRLYGFFCELRRRKVYRSAAGYLVASWVLVQVTATLVPALELPQWMVRAVIVTVLAGFPLALVLAWAFDIGPHGFARTAPQPVAEDCPPALAPRSRNIYLLLIAGLVVSAVVGFLLWPRTSRAPLQKSIAVLPFDNLSDDKQNEYFADGLQDDLLTMLAKVSDLKVISRTSVMTYKGKQHNIREIGRALGVSAGS